LKETKSEMGQDIGREDPFLKEAKPENKSIIYIFFCFKLLRKTMQNKSFCTQAFTDKNLKFPLPLMRAIDI